MNPISRFTAYVFLIAIVFIFLFFAFRGIHDQGLLYHDSGSYLLGTRFVDESLRILSEFDFKTMREIDFWNHLKHETTGVPLRFGKPGYNTVLWVVGIFTGFTDSLPAITSILSSLVMLVLTFFVGKRLGNTTSAIYATILLAASSFSLMYARSGFADPLTTVFFLAGIACYLRADKAPHSKSMYYMAGLCIGYAFTVNQLRTLYMLGLIFLLEFSRTMLWEKSGWKPLFRNGLLIGLGFGTPLLFFQLPYMVVQLIIGPLPSAIPDYWTQLSHGLNQFHSLQWFDQWGELAKSIWLVEGPLLCGLVAMGWLFVSTRLVARRRFEDFVILALSFIPFLYFCSWTYLGEVFPRIVSSLFPFCCIAAAQPLWSIQRSLKMGGAVIPAILIAALLFLILPRNTKTVFTRSGYREASDYLLSTGEKKFMILGMEPVWRAYMGRVAFDPYERPKSLRELVSTAQANNIRYVIADFSTFYSKYGMEYTSSLAELASPQKTFENPRGRSLPHLLDIFGLETARRVAADPVSDKIFIFSIENIAASLKKLNASVS